MPDLPITPSSELRQCHQCGNKTLRDTSVKLGSIEVNEFCSHCQYKGVRKLHRRQVQPGSNNFGQFARKPTLNAHDPDPMDDLRKKWQEEIP